MSTSQAKLSYFDPLLRDVPAMQPDWVAWITRTWLTWVCVALLGYVVMGRGFAYIGVPPLFAAELLAIMGIGCLLVCGRWWRIFELPQPICLIVLFIWCAGRTIPFIKEDGLDCLRDAVLWAYGIYAFAISGVIICQPTLLPLLVQRYRKFFKIVLICMPIAWIVYQQFPEVLPTWPWASSVTVIYLKAGDCQVHLGGIFGYWSSEVAGAVAPIWFILLFMNAALFGPTNRGGMMAFLSSIAVSLIFKPASKWAWGFIGVAFAGLVVLLISGVSFNLPGSERPISGYQLIENFISVGTQNGDLDELQGTKQWRLDFWHAIINDTVYGKYFWTGQGFGLNLATHYGFEVTSDDSVRAPHNGHITMLARAGVPGFVLWVIVHLGWAAGMINCYIRSRFSGQKKWAGLFMWLTIYWLMIVINASFDPYIEGPMGGVWLWSIYGVGLAAMWLRPRMPMLLGDPNPATDTFNALADLGASAEA